jgi:hypothetical protein
MVRAGWAAQRVGADARERIVELTDTARAALPAIRAEWEVTAAALAALDDELPYPLTHLRDRSARRPAAQPVPGPDGGRGAGPARVRRRRRPPRGARPCLDCSSTCGRCGMSADFRRLTVGTLLSSLGAQMTTFAVALQVYTLTGSSAAVGGVGLAAGAALDRRRAGRRSDHRRRRPARARARHQQLLALISALFAVQAFAGLGNIWLLYGLVALQFPGRVRQRAGPQDVRAAAAAARADPGLARRSRC